MGTPKPRISIVGLGLVGGSIGLALKKAGVASAVVGHDKDPGASVKAKKVGAVDRTDWNLISACEGSDLVILSLPLGAIEETMKAIASYLRPGCVVMDTATLKEPVLEWATAAFPAEVHFIGGNPILVRSAEGHGGLDAARADLFQGGLFCLTPSSGADEAAVKLVADLVTMLGAGPVFFDPAEHDGLLAAVDHLPTFVSLALMDSVVRQPSWRELRKVAGTTFELGTQAAVADPADYAALCLSNRENLVRWIDVLSTSLASLRQSVVEGNSKEIAERFEKATVERQKWLHDRAKAQWEPDQGIEIPKSNVFADAFLGGWWRKRQKKEQ